MSVQEQINADIKDAMKAKNVDKTCSTESCKICNNARSN